MTQMRKTVSGALIQVPLVLWTVLALVPFVFISLLAFRPQRDIFAYPLGLGGDFTVENFIVAWNGPVGGEGLSTYLWNSAVTAVIGLLVNLGTGAPAAYFISRLGKRSRDALLLVFVAATVMPLVLLVIPYYQLFDMFGMTNAPAAVGVAFGVLSLPTTVLVMHAFYLDFPKELVEAASLDGLSVGGSFLRVVLPLSVGPMVGVGLLSLVFIWGESQLGIVLLNNAEAQNVPVGLLGFKGQFFTQLGPIFAGLAIASVPIIIVYLLLNKHITKGIALGGVFR